METVQGVKCHFNSALCPNKYTAITLFGRVFFRCKKSTFDWWYEVKYKFILNHERIHIMQANRDGWLKFYFIYARDYLRNKRTGMSNKEAYHAIPYEVEAFNNEYNLSYAL